MIAAPAPLSRILGRVVGWLVVAAVLLLVAVTLVPTILGYGRYVIVSGSMTGTYDTGSMVYTKAIPTKDLRVGDVITYSPPAGKSLQSIVTHRISSRTVNAKGETVFRTKGDANQSPDPWTFSLTAPTQATVRFGIPDVGYVVSALSRPQVRRLAIGAPAVAIAVLAVLGLLRDARREALAASAEADETDEETPSVPVVGPRTDDAAPATIEPYTVFPAAQRRMGPGRLRHT